MLKVHLLLEFKINGVITGKRSYDKDQYEYEYEYEGEDKMRVYKGKDSGKTTTTQFRKSKTERPSERYF